MLMSWLSVIATMLNWITSLQRKIQWSRWSMIAIESEFKLSRGFFFFFRFVFVWLLLSFYFSLFRFLASVFVKWFFFIMRTLVAVIIAMIAQQKSVNDHLFSGAFLVFQTYIHIFHNQFRPPQNQFLSFYLACQSDITDHGSNVVSHLLQAVFACHRNCSGW